MVKQKKQIFKNTDPQKTKKQTQLLVNNSNIVMFCVGSCKLDGEIICFTPKSKKLDAIISHGLPCEFYKRLFSKTWNEML